MAPLPYYWRAGRRRQRLPRLLRPIAVSAELVHPPPWAGNGAGVRRRRHRLGYASPVGAASDRADRLAHGLHSDGHSGAGRRSHRSICCCESGRRISGCCRMATPRRRLLPQSRSRHRRSRLVGTDWTLRRALALRVSGGSRSVIFAACTSGTRCRCTRPNSCSTLASARMSRSGRSAWSACSASPARSGSGISPTGSGVSGSGR